MPTHPKPDTFANFGKGILSASSSSMASGGSKQPGLIHRAPFVRLHADGGALYTSLLHRADLSGLLSPELRVLELWFIAAALSTDIIIAAAQNIFYDLIVREFAD